MHKQNVAPVKEIHPHLGYLPPQETELEQAVLGAALLEKDGTRVLISLIKAPECFYRQQHQEIFRAIKQVWAGGSNPDILTVTEELRKNGTLETVGGPFYIMDLTRRVNSAGNIQKHCAILLEKFTRRQIITEAQKLTGGAYDDTADVFDLLAQTQTTLNNASETLSIKQPKTLLHLLPDAFKEIEHAGQMNGLTGIPSGLEDLDRATGGAQPGELIIIAARPAMGKTTLALNMAKNAAIMHEKKVAIFSLEMSSLQLVKKFIVSETRLYSASELIKGAVKSVEDLENLKTQSRLLFTQNLIIDDDAGLSIPLLRAKVAKLIADFGIEEIIIDYIQLMQGEKGGTREQEISSISRGLKLIAKDFNIPVIALSQLSRAVESRDNKKPMLSDLRESGAIEQDADSVYFVYRPEYYGITEDEEGNSTENIGYVIIAKQRNGGLAEIALAALLKYSLFADISELSKPVANAIVIPASKNYFPASNFYDQETPF